MRFRILARARFAIFLLLILSLPFGEGGASPAALFIAHSLILLSLFLLLVDSGESPEAATSLRRALPVWLFLGVVLISSIRSPYPYASFLRGCELAVALLALLLARALPASELWRRRLGDLVLLSATIQALVVLGGWISLRQAEGLARFGLLNGNHEAAYLGMGILLSLPRFLPEMEKENRLRGAAAGICLLSFCLLSSRGALAGIISGTILVLALRWRFLSGRGRRVVLFAALLSMGAACLLVWNRFQVSEDPFRYQRLQIWAADLRASSGEPWLGIGPGVYRHVAHRFNFPLPGPIRYGRNFQTAHSDYLGILVETGILGAAAGLILLVWLAGFLRVRARDSGFLALGLSGSAMAFAVQAVGEDLSIRPAILITFAVLLGYLGATPRAPAPDPGANRSRGVLLRSLILGPALVWLWAVAVLEPYRGYRHDQAMRHAGSFPEMERHFDLALSANPYQAQTYRFPAAAFLAARPEVTLSADLYARFRRDLDRGIEVDRTSADLYLTRARLEARALRTLFHDEATRTRALRSYREGIRRTPHDPRPRLELAVFLQDQGRTEEALLQLDRCLAEEPSYLLARLLKCELLLASGKAEEARSCWREEESLRSQLSTYRPDSVYAADLTRDEASLRNYLEARIGAP